MINNNHNEKANKRWSRLGPYYAMFPYSYAEEIIAQHTKLGDAVLDPFAGRFSSTVAASYAGRLGVGIEISPLGCLYGRAKIFPAQRMEDLLRRLSELMKMSSKYRRQARDMGEFFHMCYCESVLCFLLACRDNMNWGKNIVDATLMAQILTSLHHALGKGLSNQMRQTKSMSPDYSIRWWKANGFNNPPDINPKDFLTRRLEWRYRHGAPPQYSDSRVYCSDSTTFLDSMPPPKNKNGKFDLLFTSPPYHNLVNYHKDQWLRLWMLGGEPSPQVNSHKHKNNFCNKKVYESMLDLVFKKSARMMNDQSVVVVRTDSREYTQKTTMNILQKHFPHHQVKKNISNAKKQGQTALFCKMAKKNQELDLILTLH